MRHLDLEMEKLEQRVAPWLGLPPLPPILGGGCDTGSASASQTASASESASSNGDSDSNSGSGS